MGTLSKLRVLALVGSLAIAPVFATICDQTYRLQSATETILEGPSLNNLTATKKQLKLDLTDATILKNEMQYILLKEFEGACNYQKRMVKFRARPAKANWANAEQELFVRLYDASLVGSNFKYWFHMSADTSKFLGSDILGKSQQETDYTRWHMIATMIDSTKGESGLWSVGEPYYPSLSIHYDSTTLDSLFLKSWREIKLGPNRRAHFKVQIIKTVYDSIGPTTQLAQPLAREGRAVPEFHASQTGKSVLIRLSEKAPDAEVITLYNMMGRKVAVLHPTGNAFQWNGKTEGGSDAPKGIYFVQGRSGILGKFFYSPVI